ncbi:MAG TPA: hypothetical protein VKP67_17060 [Xanthobacteraceae bacterium]|nr:hypothetical protein [Xanthobacteraceae bacterium]
MIDNSNIDDMAADLFRPHMVDPEILCDTKYPTVEPGAWLPLIQVGQSSQKGFLDQILAAIQIARKPAYKAVQPRQQFH